MKTDIRYVSVCPEDEYTEFVKDRYDYNYNGEVVTDVPIIDMNELSGMKWNVGCILGESGSGKSTVLGSIGNARTVSYDMDKSIVSQFDHLDPDGAVSILQSVGLSSIPLYFHKPNELSLGQRARLDIAWQLANSNGEVVLVDEYTSVVNRACAKSMSFAVQRYVRRNDIRLIVASCHYDIVEWLRPDWVFNLSKPVNGRPEIEFIDWNGQYKEYSSVNKRDVLSCEMDV